MHVAGVDVPPKPIVEDETPTEGRCRARAGGLGSAWPVESPVSTAAESGPPGDGRVPSRGGQFSPVADIRRGLPLRTQQVRDEYSINGSFHRRLFNPSGDDFRGFQRLRPGWHASWPFFFELDGQSPQLSRAIDTSLAPTWPPEPGVAQQPGHRASGVRQQRRPATCAAATCSRPRSQPGRVRGRGRGRLHPGRPSEGPVTPRPAAPPPASASSPAAVAGR